MKFSLFLQLTHRSPSDPQDRYPLNIHLWTPSPTSRGGNTPSLCGLFMFYIEDDYLPPQNDGGPTHRLGTFSSGSKYTRDPNTSTRAKVTWLPGRVADPHAAQCQQSADWEPLSGLYNQRPLKWWMTDKIITPMWITLGFAYKMPISRFQEIAWLMCVHNDTKLMPINKL